MKQPLKPPPLGKRSNSWVVTRIADNSVIGEFYNPATVAKFNAITCRAENSHDYLCRLNAENSQK